MAFEKPIPQWFAEGSEPPESLKQSGFTAGYKPPADYFNWFWYSVSQCLAELQEKAGEDIGLHASSHGKDGNDPITAVSIGAAPSGFGYGEQMTEVSSPDGETYEAYCTKVDAILSKMADRQTMQINVTPPNSEDATFGACAATLYKGTNAYASLVTIGHSNKYAFGWRMQKRAGVWEPFEWIDPPMEAGVAYRTTERYNGNPVYKKLGTDNILYWSTDNVTWNTYASMVSGVLGGRVMANTNASANIGNAQVRNIMAGTDDLTAGSTTLSSGAIYLVYE